MTFPTLIVEVGFVSSASTSSYLFLDDSARGKLNTGTLAPADVWTDVSSYVIHANVTRGSRRADGPLVRYEAGQASIVFKNDDRRFDPTNTAGPYSAAGVSQ